MAVEELVYGMAGGKCVLSGVEDLCGNLPCDGVFSDKTEVFIGEYLPEICGDLAFLGEILLRHVGPIHHV